MKWRRGSLARIGQPRPSRSGFTAEQLKLATFIEGEQIRIGNLPTLEPFRVLDLEPTVNIGDINQQAVIRLAMLDDDTIRESGLHRQPGKWLLKARWLRARLQEAWKRLDQLHQNYELEDYARARGAPAPTVREAVPPRIKAAIATSASSTTNKGKPLPN